MGIKNFFKLVDGTKITLKQLSNKTIIIDALEMIYRSILALPEPLTNTKGEPTAHINTIFMSIVQYKILNIIPIFVFDTVPNKMKNGTLIKREEARKKASEQLIQETNEERKGKLLKRTFTMTAKMINDVKYLLDEMGVLFINAPNGIEAEQYAAFLVKQNYGYAVMSSDADTLLFGATRMIKREKGGKYSLYELNNILTKLDVNMDTLIKIGVALGCDFAEKSKGVGVKTVLKKLKEDKIKFSEEQNKAMQLFVTVIKDDKTFMRKSSNKKYISHGDEQLKLETLYTWLINEQTFNTNRVHKLLVKYGYTGKLIIATETKGRSEIPKDVIDLDTEGVDEQTILDSMLND